MAERRRIRSVPTWTAAAAALAATPAIADIQTAKGASHRAPYTLADARQISAFGERPAFSPDGSRLAFVGKTFGDAFEVELATGRIRNLTANVPHQGVLRVQYLPNGDYLIIGPRAYVDRSSRFDAEMWILDKSLTKPLVPLNQKVFEGVAISRKSLKIAWLEMGPGFEKPRIEKGQYVVPDASKGALLIFTGDIVYENGVPRLINRKEVLRRILPDCGAEPQDFHNGDRDLTISCATAPKDDGFWSSAMSLELATGKLTTYRAEDREYNEIEGMAPDESWSLVECGPRLKSGLAPLDLCRLELKPNGKMTPLVVTPRPSPLKTTNGVVSPTGELIAFQSADSRSEIGIGEGVYVLKIDDPQ